MKKISLFIIPISFFLFFGLAKNVQASCDGASPNWTSTADYTSVNDCVTKASAGDTITVSGNATWTTTLTLAKGVKLVGSGNPVIAYDISCTGDWWETCPLIRVNPNSSAQDNHESFDIEGFTFDMNNKSMMGIGCITALNSASSPMTKFIYFILQHNTFVNGTGASNNRAFHLSSKGIKGVAANNILDCIAVPWTIGGGDLDGWSNYVPTFGDGEAFYIENNLIKVSGCSIPISGWIESGGAAKEVIRYNTWDETNGRQDSIWDVHGLQSMRSALHASGTVTGGSATTLIDTTKNFVTLHVVVGSLVTNLTKEKNSYVTSISTTTNANDTLHFSDMGATNSPGDSYRVGYDQSLAGYEGYEPADPVQEDLGNPGHKVCQQYSTMNSEFYGNAIINMARPQKWFGLRGGRNLTFDNTYGPSIATSITTNEYSCDICQYEGAYSQHIQNTYVWNNFTGSPLARIPMINDFDFCASSVDANGNPSPYRYTITENKDFFNYNATCTASSCASGIGCGATVPTGTCTQGIAYWKTAQSCANMTGMTGANPISPIQGTLYKCTSTNHWEVYYRPYIYPHPLTQVAYGTAICSEGAITSACWCEGQMRATGECNHGYYANGSACLTPGDFTCNGYNISDLQTMISIILGTDSTTNRTQADMSTPPDDLVNISDLQLLINKVLGIN